MSAKRWLLQIAGEDQEEARTARSRRAPQNLNNRSEVDLTRFRRRVRMVRISKLAYQMLFKSKNP